MGTTTVAAASLTGAEAHALRLVAARDKRVLDPVERFSEIIFGLVMVLTFTGTFSVAESGRQEVRDMLVAALGCNIAWGLVDGVMYVVTAVVERARRVAVLHGIRAAGPEGARAIVVAALPEGVAAVTDDAIADHMVARARAMPAPPLRARVHAADLRGAVGSGLLVVAATFPPAIPFLFAQDVQRALRLSNAAAVATLFCAGYALGNATGVRPWLLGLSMVLLGGTLVAITIALGG